VPDMKWDQGSVGSLYCLAIVMRRDLPSLRALTAEHLPLLKNVYDKGCKALSEKYGIQRDKLRVYLHYQPTFYHLHVHFTNLDFEAAGTGIGKAHALLDVIDNIELKGDYYQCNTMTFNLRTTLGLYKEFDQAGLLQS